MTRLAQDLRCVTGAARGDGAFGAGFALRERLGVDKSGHATQMLRQGRDLVPRGRSRNANPAPLHWVQGIRSS